jgi:hypothetical protein
MKNDTTKTLIDASIIFKRAVPTADNKSAYLVFSGRYFLGVVGSYFDGMRGETRWRWSIRTPAAVSNAWLASQVNFASRAEAAADMVQNGNQLCAKCAFEKRIP